MTQWDDPPMLYPAQEMDRQVFHTVIALHRRLFPAEPAPLMLTGPSHGGRVVRAAPDATLQAAGYTLTFGTEITLHHADPDGLRHGILALTQMAHAARIDARFQFPAQGRVTDHPRFEWRGLMLDVVRNFFPVSTVTRLLDIMAWLRMNRFHWHLTDDEAWRMGFVAQMG